MYLPNEDILGSLPCSAVPRYPRPWCPRVADAAIPPLRGAPRGVRELGHWAMDIGIGLVSIGQVGIG